MRAVLCLLVVALVASVAHARELEQLAGGTDCFAAAAVAGGLFGAGFASGRAESTCKAQSSARSDIVDVISKTVVEVFNPSAGCTKKKAEETLEGLANATASAYASVTLEVQLSGDGAICASAVSQADAFAVAYMNIILKLASQLVDIYYPETGYGEDILDATVGDTSVAKGRSAGQAAAIVFADAWAKVQGKVCQAELGADDFFDEAFTRATSQALGLVWTTVHFELCSNFMDQVNPDELGAIGELKESFANAVSDLFTSVDFEGSVQSSIDKGDSDLLKTGGTFAILRACGSPENELECCTEDKLTAAFCDCGFGCSFTDPIIVPGFGGGDLMAKIWRDGEDICACTADILRTEELQEFVMGGDADADGPSGK